MNHRARRLLAPLLVAWVAALLPWPAAAERLRIATYNAELVRDGPGLLLRDILRGEDDQIDAVVAVIARNRPDVLALQGFDWDLDGRALAAFADRLAEVGTNYPHLFHTQPNSGLATGLDMDGDGRAGRAADAQGFGAFTGQGGMAVLSRLPILADELRDFTDVLWRDLPGALLPTHEDGSPFPSPEARAIQRLSNSAHWLVPIALPGGGRFDLLTFRAAPPVFDGPEDRNGRRNHDEILFWTHLIDGRIGAPPSPLFVLAGGATLDPFDSDGRPEAIAALLAHPALQDPAPASPGAAAAPDQGHSSPNALDTVDWPPPGPGRLRVDYVLPSRRWQVLDAGVDWPVGAEDAAAIASRHRLVWVDLALPGTP